MIRRGDENASDPSFGGSFGLVSAAHELKSPTSLVRQLALELRDTVATEHERRLLDQIVLTSERSLRLTSSLTKMARLEDGLFELEPINAQQLCEEVAHEISPLYKSHDKRIEVQYRRAAPLVIANRDLLRRVLLGFADNALYYSGNAAAVTLGVQRKHHAVHVGLRDKGPIVPQAARRAMTGRPAASGIGLMIADRFAEAMQGSIGSLRHHDGMTFYIAMQESEQLALL